MSDVASDDSFAFLLALLSRVLVGRCRRHFFRSEVAEPELLRQHLIKRELVDINGMYAERGTGG